MVTGIGAVSGYGWGGEALRRGLRSGTTVIRETRRFDTRAQRTRIAAEVPGSTPDGSLGSGARSGAALTDRFALAAGLEAWAQARPRVAPERLGVFFGTSTAGMAEAEGLVARMLGIGSGPRRLRSLVSQQLNSPGDALARELGARGQVWTVSSACASGALAIGEALELLREGELDIAVAGGADSLAQLTYSGFNSLRAVDEEPCLPFRSRRAGLSLGEGAAVLVLERLSSAIDRNQRPLAEVAGFGTTCDAHHMTAPEPNGRGASEAIRLALRDAELKPADVTVINAHGTGTPLNDSAETRALEAVFGAGEVPPLTAPKGSVGHLLGSSGAIEAVTVILGFEDGCVYATPGPAEADPELAVDLVTGASRRLSRPAVALSTSLAFGGANAALVLATSDRQDAPDE